MLMTPRLRHYIHNFGAILYNQAQWVVLRGYFGGDIGIVNVYASHSLHEQINLWIASESLLPIGLWWVLTEDWNVVLSH